MSLRTLRRVALRLQNLQSGATYVLTAVRIYAVLWLLSAPAWAHNCGSPDDCGTPPAEENRSDAVPVGPIVAGGASFSSFGSDAGRIRRSSPSSSTGDPTTEPATGGAEAEPADAPDDADLDAFVSGGDPPLVNLPLGQ